MSIAPAIPIRPGKGRIAAIALLGPLVGTVVVFAYLSLVNAPGEISQPASVMFGFLLFYGYMFGLIPSIIAAAAYAFAYPRLFSRWRQLLACLVIGALSGAIGVWLTISIFANAFVLEPVFMAVAALAGAIALPVTALAFSARP